MPLSAPRRSSTPGMRPVALGARGELRVERFLDAAAAVFAEKGYQQAHLSEIVSRAGGSLATLYRVFGDKEGLAFAIVQRRLQAMTDRLNAMQIDGLPPAEALHKAGHEIAASLTSADAALVHRIVIGEGRAFPALRDFFFDHAIASIGQCLGRYFEHQVAAGTLVLHASPAAAASQFFMMLFGETIIRTACGHLEAADRTALGAHVDASVTQFLRGALPR